MYNNDEPPLEGEFLRAVCAALSRNGIRSLKGAPISPDPYDFTPAKMPPQSEQRPPNALSMKGENRALASWH